MSLDNINSKAYATARHIVRRKIMEQAGADYASLTESNKQKVDRLVESKQKLVKEIASKLVQKHKSVDQMFMEYFPQYDTSNVLGQKVDNPVTSGSQAAAGGPAGKNNNVIVQYSKFGNEKIGNTPVAKAIGKKAAKAGVKEEVLGEVYDRGMDAWSEDTGVTQQQYAFARVNSFINKGKSYYNEDADLHEARPVNNPFYDESEKAWNERKAAWEKEQKKKQKTNEDVEPVNEISKQLATSYFHKKQDQARKRFLERGLPTNKKGVLLAKAKIEGDAKVPATNEETDLEAYMARHRQVMDKYGHKYLHTTKQHTGEHGSGYVTGHDPSKKGHVILTVNTGQGVRSKNDNPTKDISVHPKHLTPDWKKSHYGVSESREDVHAVARQDDGDRKAIKNVERKPDVKSPNDIKSALTRNGETQRKILEARLGNSQNKPSKRQIGTDSPVKAYTDDTPNMSVNESFNIAFAAGVGVTLTAADLGMRAQSGFAYHPSVVEQMQEVEEEVRSADRAPVVVPSHSVTKTDPETGQTKTFNQKGFVKFQKTQKKIIGSGNVHDGNVDKQSGGPGPA